MVSITDKFKKTYNAANPNVASVTATRASLGVTLTCDNLSGWPTDTPVDFSTYRRNSSNQVIAGTQIDWKGIVSGNNIGTLTRITGASDSGSTIGDIVEMNPTANWANDLMIGLLTHSNQDGTLKTDAATTTVIKDANVTTAKIADAAITSAKLAPTKSVDANGWTVYDYGTWKEYERAISVAGISAISAFNQFTPAAYTNIALPSGVASLSGMQFSAFLACQFSGAFAINSSKNGGSGTSPVNNTALTFPIYNGLNFAAQPGDTVLYLRIKER